MADEDALRYGIDAVTGFTGNPHFPKITPTPEDLKATVDTYTTSLGVAANRGLAEIAVKNNHKTSMLTVLRDMIRMANLIAKGDPVALASLGLPLTKDPAPRQLGVADPRVEPGAQSGTLVLSTPAVPGAVSYVHQMTEDPASGQWEEVISSATRSEWTNVVFGKMYYFRIIAIGTKNQKRSARL